MRKFEIERRLRVYSRVPRGTSHEHHLLEAAWLLARRSNASSPGRAVAYYSAKLHGEHYPGERDWDQRWHDLSSCVNLANERVLELGCNLGLLSSYSMRFAGASAALGVDCDPTIVVGARLVAEALGVEPEFKCVDLDGPDPWERHLLEFDPSVVFALNVIEWVADTDRLLRFLGSATRVVVEGHDDAQTEIRRLRDVGFATTTVVKDTERGRPLLVAERA